MMASLWCSRRKSTANRDVKREERRYKRNKRREKKWMDGWIRKKHENPTKVYLIDLSFEARNVITQEKRHK